MAAIAPPSSSSSLKPSPYLTSGSTKSPHPISRFTHPFSPLPQKPTPFRHLQISSSLSPKTVATIATTTNPPDPEAPISRFAPDEPRKGADVLVEALERQGVTNVFAYPGGALMEIHQALTRSSSIRNVLPRHEQGGVFAAEGYAPASGCPGVCIATSGPGATNLVSESKKPVLYVDGGCLNSSEELRRFVELTGIPVASTLMGLGAYPCNDEDLSLQMLGMHGTVYANYAVDESDLLLAFGVRTKGLFVFLIGETTCMKCLD